jgi:hypothetical protein
MAQSPQAEAGAARPPSPSGGPRGRCVALVCNSWGHASTFYTWNWAKQYLLRRGPDGRLDPSEQLFIVKVGKDDLKDDRWKVGGPLVPDLETALVKYPHKEVVLEGGIKHNIAVWLAQQHVDVLVIPDQWPQSMLQKGLQITSGALGSRWHCYMAAMMAARPPADHCSSSRAPSAAFDRLLMQPRCLQTLSRWRSVRVGQGQRALPLCHHPPGRCGERAHEDWQPVAAALQPRALAQPGVGVPCRHDWPPCVHRVQHV